MSSKEENPSLTGYYSLEKFIKELKKISGIPDSLTLDDFQSNMPLHTSSNETNAYFSPYYKNRAEQKSKILKINNINNEINPNEAMKQEMTKLRKENAELKYCLNNINKKFENETKELRNNNELKEKELKETKEILKKNANLIELLGEKITGTEERLNDINEQTQKKFQIVKDNVR